MGSRVQIRLFHILHFVRDLLFPLLKNSKSGVDDRGHRLRITHTHRQLYILQQQRNNNRQVANLKGALLGNIMTTVVKTEVNPYNEQHF